MITYEEALAKAKAWKPNIDNCREHTNAYEFGSHADDDFIGPEPCVVLKETGEIFDMTDYLGTGYGGEFIRGFPV